MTTRSQTRQLAVALATSALILVALFIGLGSSIAQAQSPASAIPAGCDVATVMSVATAANTAGYWGITVNLASCQIDVIFNAPVAAAPAVGVPLTTTAALTSAMTPTLTAPVTLRYDNAGCATNYGLARGQSKTVAWHICNASSPTEAWIAIQTEATAVGATTVTAPVGTEITQELPLGTDWVIWNSTCPSFEDGTKNDVQWVSLILRGKGPGCIRLIPAAGAEDRIFEFEQAVAVH